MAVNNIPRYLILGNHSEDRIFWAFKISQKIAEIKDKEIDFSRRGIYDLSESVLETQEYLKGFDKILALDQYIERKLITYFEIEESKILCLNISENQERAPSELIGRLEEKLRDLI